MNRIVLVGLTLTAIVAYARPFIFNKDVPADNKLSPDILDVLNKEALELLNDIVKHRNTIMVHTDADTNRSYPVVVDPGHRKIVAPVNASPYVVISTKERMEQNSDLAFKLQEEVFSRRRTLEPLLIDHLPVMKNTPDKESPE